MIRRARLHVRAMVVACGAGRVLRLQLLMLLGALLEAVVLVLLVPLVQLLAGDDDVRVPVLGVDVGPVALLGVAGAAVLLRGAVQWRSAITNSDVLLRTTDALRLRALRGVLEADWTYLVRQRRSDVVQATTTEMERVDAAVHLLLRSAVDLLLLAASAAVAVVISPCSAGSPCSRSWSWSRSVAAASAAASPSGSSGPAATRSSAPPSPTRSPRSG